MRQSGLPETQLPTTSSKRRALYCGKHVSAPLEACAFRAGYRCKLPDGAGGSFRQYAYIGELRLRGFLVSQLKTFPSRLVSTTTTTTTIAMFLLFLRRCPSETIHSATRRDGRTDGRSVERLVGRLVGRSVSRSVGPYFLRPLRLRWALRGTACRSSAAYIPRN